MFRHDSLGWLQEQLSAASPDLLRAMVASFAQAVGARGRRLIGASYGERSEERTNSRNGYRALEWDAAPAPRIWRSEAAPGQLLSGWLLERRRRAEQALVATSYLPGYPPGAVEKLIEQLGITRLSKSQVNGLDKAVQAQVAAFRNRPLDASAGSRSWIDALAQRVREGGRTVIVHALVATGVNADGHREISAWTSSLPRTARAGGVPALAGHPRLVRCAHGYQRLHVGLRDATAATPPGASQQR